MSAALDVRGLSKSFQTAGGETGAIDRVTFNVEAGQFYTLLGPSGCGKSTTLRAIAGLERPDAGDIIIDGRVVDSVASGVHVAPNDRPIAMVFQSYAIWPHMSVFENVAYPLRVRKPKLGDDVVRDRVMEALRLVQMADLAGRPAPQLSGGQQQRVALARAVVSKPRLLLLDEPLSNLDARLRDGMRRELGALIASLKMTTLFVTHDQGEALAMSDRIAVMDRGSIVQEGSPLEIYRRPCDRFVADFLGAANLLEGSIAGDRDDGSVEVAVGNVRLAVKGDRRAGTPGAARVTVVVRPEDIAVSRVPMGEQHNVFDVTVDQVTFQGSFVECRVTGGMGSLLVRVQGPDVPSERDRIWIRIAPEACQLLGLAN
jgi:iron(III) transport system ATP-binding protein